MKNSTLSQIKKRENIDSDMDRLYLWVAYKYERFWARLQQIFSSEASGFFNE